MLRMKLFLSVHPRYHFSFRGGTVRITSCLVSRYSVARRDHVLLCYRLGIIPQAPVPRA